MNNEYKAQLNKQTQASFETFQQFNGLKFNTLQNLIALQSRLTTLNLDATAAQVNLFSSCTNPEALFTAETELARVYGENLQQLASDTAELASQSHKQTPGFAEQSLQENNETSASPAKAAKKTRARKTTKKAA